MIQITPQMRILLAVEPADFRKGIDGLAQICRQRLKADPLSGAMFIFSNRRRKALKILVYDGQGFWLCQKRLSQGRFTWWPNATESATSRLDVHQVQLLLWNGNPESGHAAPMWRSVGQEFSKRLVFRLGEMGIGVKRVQLPPGVDVNALACQSADAAKALAALLEEAHVLVAHAAEQAAKNEKAAEADLTPEPFPMPEAEQPPFILAAPVEPPSAPPGAVGAGPACLHPQIRGEDIFFRLGEREYRIRGLSKNSSYEALKINLRVKLDEDHYHQDNIDLARAREREHFGRVSAAETGLKEEIIKRDLSRLLLKLEELQEEQIRRSLEPKGPVVPGMSEEERQAAMAFLQAPNLRELIVEHFRACGVVGEESRIEIGYYAALSRKFEKPLGVIIQSTSAAGKTTLMEAILSMMPPEECIQYSAMTGQALFYLGEADLKNKILAIAEEEGAERATYALKLLQSEGKLTIASTGKDGTSGRLITETYHVEGPAMIFFTTTSIDLDEELANRCLTLTVDESREQTRRIHELQREEETIEGHLCRAKAQAIRKLHQNAQRLLQPLPVHNPFARQLTFPDESTRLRRDQKKYLTLIRAIALLHQHQRPRQKIEGVEHIEVTLEDIAAANRLAGEVLGRSLDEMPPQTRRFLDLLLQMVEKLCQEKEIELKHCRFSQRDARTFTGWSAPQVKRHLARLVELEYLILHRGVRGQTFVYELLYQGEGRDGSTFLPGLIDIEKLKKAANSSAPSGAMGAGTACWDGQNMDRDASGMPPAPPVNGSGSAHRNGLSSNPDAGQMRVDEKLGPETH